MPFLVCTVIVRLGLFLTVCNIILSPFSCAPVSECRKSLNEFVHPPCPLGATTYMDSVKHCWAPLVASSFVLGDPVDPFNVVSNLGVDPGEVSIGTADAPGHNALKFTITYERTSRVPLQKQQRGEMLIQVLSGYVWSSERPQVQYF